jgi:hypothetical protein
VIICLLRPQNFHKQNGKNCEHNKILIVHEGENYDLISCVCGAPLPLLHGSGTKQLDLSTTSKNLKVLHA